jgi:hypothetical protein
MVFLEDGKTVLTGASSDSEINLVTSFLYDCFGVEFEKVNPSFDESIACKSFFRYLFMKQEQQENPVYSIISPLSFTATEDQFCTKLTANGELASLSPEVLASLKSGKELAKLKIVFTGDAVMGGNSNDVWSFTIKPNLTISSLKTPEGEELGFRERIVEKVALMKIANDFLYNKVKEYLSEKDKNDTAIEEWIKEK